MVLAGLGKKGYKGEKWADTISVIPVNPFPPKGSPSLL